jgi:putative hydrolase of the HAD superfamily
MKSNDHIENFVFDLDETLYSPKVPIMKIVGDKINEFMHKYLHMKEEEIPIKRNYYKSTYGTTLYGLMKEFNIDPEEFLLYVHNIDYKKVIKKDIELKCELSKLKGKFFIYTNASKNHAKCVLEQLGVEEYFENIISIEDTDYIPKPSIEGFHKFVDKVGINCKKSVFIENSSVNLHTAKLIDMQTAIVWDKYINCKDFDYYLETIYNLDILVK